MVKRNASDSDIASLIAQDMNNSEIARALHVDRKRAAAVRNLMNHPADLLDKPVSIDRVRAIVRLELTQEETLNELSDQLAEYTKNYKASMLLRDNDAAGKWAVLRLKILESMIKITQLDQRIEPPPSPQDAISQMSDEEVERRAKGILARRQ
jgi:hypothetical protein